jgi:hypothetical protein
VRLRRKPGRPKPWRGQPTLIMQLKDPQNPGSRLAYHTVKVFPIASKAKPRVILNMQTGGTFAIADLAEDEVRALSKALIEGIEEAKSAIAANEPGAS